MSKEIEDLVIEFGEESRLLIEESLKLLKDKEPLWDLKKPINKRTFIKSLIPKK